MSDWDFKEGDFSFHFKTGQGIARKEDLLRFEMQEMRWVFNVNALFVENYNNNFNVNFDQISKFNKNFDIKAMQTKHFLNKSEPFIKNYNLNIETINSRKLINIIKTLNMVKGLK